ncbi:MAG: hypothetical protein QM673_17470, partial [Gordonia sp. (in: high G+C Gram-positive bacteria)]
QSPSAARRAYETLEPLHVLAYFNPGLKAAQHDTGLTPYAFYIGARGAPLGECAPNVVVSSFYNFAPGMVTQAWRQARDVGLARVAARREQMLDEQLRTILGDLVTDPVIATAADRFGALAAGLAFSGRPLAAAWASAAVPEPAHLRLWHNVTILREWRGDNHIAVLINSGLDGIDALTFHESTLPDPTVRRRVLGRDRSLLTRAWTPGDWDDSVDRLVGRGLAERTEDSHRLTPAGAVLYDEIEAATDALGERVWSSPGVDELLADIRPFVKAVIDAGVLPGTRKRD